MHRLVPATILALCTTGGAASYTLPVNLGSVSNPGILQADKALERPGLNAAQRAALSRNGFVITPATWRQFDAAYEAYRYADQPVFVTTDSMLHMYHLVFDKLLRDLERESLAPALRRMTALLLADAVKLHANLKGHPLERDRKSVV